MDGGVLGDGLPLYYILCGMREDNNGDTVIRKERIEETEEINRLLLLSSFLVRFRIYIDVVVYIYISTTTANDRSQTPTPPTSLLQATHGYLRL